jgi:oxygen-independent coproporphyrinogen-3 oxidase
MLTVTRQATQTAEELLTGTPYVSYSYSYPHKMAYRPLMPPVPLEEAWADEPKDAVFLYLHVPFCEMRCGFCNLFTTANPQASLEAEYLEALTRQARVVRDRIGPVTVGRMAVGGGTPTYLDCAGLDRLFDLAADIYGANLASTPVSVETSPRTATPDRLRLLRGRGVDRVSVGVQSFIEAEVVAVGRGQKTALVEQALTNIREAGIPDLNIDLMYGLPGQTLATWQASLHAALRFQPEEIYIYPLYVRPLTGLDRTFRSWDDQRLECYRLGRDYLESVGYEQVSMRMFRRRTAPAESAGIGPVYCCQEDGMIGLGCGARSYTTGLHYSSEYAVGRTGVKAILADYVAKPDAEFGFADHGIALDLEEQRRRYVITSLLQAEGLDRAVYRHRFDGDPLDDLPRLSELELLGLAEEDQTRLRLTPAGLERSDAIGPWLYSDRMQRLAEAFALR